MVVVVRRRSEIESRDRVTHRLAKCYSSTRNRRRRPQLTGILRFQRGGADRLDRPGQALSFGIAVNLREVKMIRVQGTSGITNLESCLFSFPRQTIVTGRHSHVEIAIHVGDGRLKDPCILARWMLEKSSRAIGSHIPARQAKQFAIEIVSPQTCEGFVEINISVGNQHGLPLEIFIGVIEQEAKSY